MSDRERRTAVVTGAGSGIGRAITLSLIADGYLVVAIGRRIKKLHETRDLAADPTRVLVLEADISEYEQVAAAFAEIRGMWQRLDVLVNNAGVFGAGAPLHKVTKQAWDDLMSVNTNGAFWCAQQAVGFMRRQSPAGGRVINIGSVSAHKPRPNSVAYAVSKHAMIGLSNAICLEGRADLVSATQIDIGNASTSMVDIAAQTSPAYHQDHPEAMFDVEHVATVVTTIASLPTDVSVSDITIFATQMPYVGRG
ncbi:SDR family oxidoreductase [Streptomyces asiaticus]